MKQSKPLPPQLYFTGCFIFFVILVSIPYHFISDDGRTYLDHLGLSVGIVIAALFVTFFVGGIIVQLIDVYKAFFK